MNRISTFLAALFVFCSSLFAQKEEGNLGIENKLGEKVFETIVATQGLYENEEMLNMVEEIGKNLELQLEKNYDFKYFLVDVPEPNAFATAGGYVFVTRGMLALINTPDELAGILGHEFTHVSQHHTTKRIPPKLVSVLLELPGNIVGALTFDAIGTSLNLPIEATSMLAMNAYSRKQESEADLLGTKLATKAGYNPYGLIYGLENLTKYIESISDVMDQSVIFMDHPITEKRVKDLRAMLKEEGMKEPKMTYGTSIKGLEGVIFGQNPDAGIIHESKFYHKNIDLYFELPKKWQFQNSPSALAAVSKDKKSSIVVSAVATEATPQEAANAAIEKIDESMLIETDSSKLNDLVAYRASFKVKKVKQPDCLTHVMWLKIPSTGVVLKVVGATDFNKPDTSIVSAFNTFRMLQEKDLEGVKVAAIKLAELDKKETLGDFFEKKGISDKEAETLEMLNAMTPEDKVTKGRYIKVLEYTPLSEY